MATPKPVKVILTAESGKGVTLDGRRQRSVEVLSVEDYSIEGSMDTDADPFGITIGDPYTDLIELLGRDVEIRCQIFGGDEQTLYLKTGFADTAGMTHDGTLTISGRDVSALAVDSDVPPNEWKNVRADKRIAKDAAELGFPATRLAEAKKFDKIYTDGSETYWEFWYRMARKRKMWLWVEADGTLVMDQLNYGGEPTYFFGHKHDKFPSKAWVPVTACEISSNKQQRVGEVHVFGETNDQPYFAHVFDRSIREWLKKPNKVIFDNDIKGKKEAQEAGYEEIFEGKVGAIEINLTIPDPGVVIRQNRIAELNLPEIGVTGPYYIVGTTTQGNSGAGFTQQVRLREKTMALSRRVPDDPELIKDENATTIPGSVFLNIPRSDWSEFFVIAAKQWAPAGIPIDLYTAVLLAICRIETNFHNIRSHVGGQGREAPYGKKGVEYTPSTQGNVIEHQHNFANHKENPFTGYDEFAVGPMQLFTRSYKVEADTRGGRSGEYDGGRWDPASNIWAAAHALAGKMAGLPHTKAGLKEAVERYNGAGSEAVAYANQVMRYVDNEYLPSTQAAFAASTPAAQGGAGLENAPPIVRKAVTAALKQLGDPYVWGGNGPNSFDCSGLCQYAYKVAGFHGGPGRWTTVNLWPAVFPRYGKAAMKAGDLVFFHGPPPSHMGMYLGDGTMVQAPHTGDVVKISSIRDGYYADSFVGAERVIKW